MCLSCDKASGIAAGPRFWGTSVAVRLSWPATLSQCIRNCQASLRPWLTRSCPRPRRCTAGRAISLSQLRPCVLPQSPAPSMSSTATTTMTPVSIGSICPARVWFPCEITGGEARSGPDTSEVGLFAEEELPAELSTRRVLLAQLKPHVRARAAPGTPNRFRLRREDYSGDRSPTHHPVLWQFGFCE